MTDEMIRRLRDQIKNLELKNVWDVFNHRGRVWEEAHLNELFEEILKNADDLPHLLELAASLQRREDVQVEFKVALLMYVRGRVKELLTVTQVSGPEVEPLEWSDDDPEELQWDPEDEFSDPPPRGMQNEVGWDFPNVDVVDARRRAYAADTRNWREAGVLSLSGYRVGRTRGLRRAERRRILNWIVIEDDLLDIDDRSYAEEWGMPGTSDRLQKVVNSIATFARDRVNDPRDYSMAIEHWTEDLEYLRRSFYEPWGETWRWPDE